MVSCAACGRTASLKNKSYGITFHRFPNKDVNRRDVWINFLKKPYFTLKQSSVLCSQHFDKKCFNRTSQRKIRLLPDALPTIEVYRYKYERTSNNFLENLGVDDEQADDELSTTSIPTSVTKHEINLSNDDGFLALPSPSVPSSPNVSLHEMSDDSPCKRILKRKIKELNHRDILNNQKIRKLQKNSWRQKKQITSLKSVASELRKKNIMLEEQGNVLMEHFGSNRDIIQRLFQKTQNRKVKHKFEQSVRAFAVTLHFFSPRAYNYVRQKFHNSLPHEKTLSKWYSSLNAEPGFTSEAIEFLKCKVQNSNNALVCSLVFDEMAIRQHLEYDGKRYYGYVDVGNCLQGESMQLARDALVFMVVCVNESWKIPFGYFFIAGINSEQKLSLTKQALLLLNQIGIIIANITFDGCPTNISMCKLLNCQFNKECVQSSFIFDDKKYFLLPDPVHMIKLIRNCFGEKHTFIDLNGNIIDFKYVKRNELQEKEGLHLGNKLRSQHINFFKQKMKVRLATQLLSQSVSDALLYCKNQLELEEFKNSGPTAEFILLINNAFDVLNSHKLNAFGFKQAACLKNIENIKSFYSNFKNYIYKLKLIDGTPILNCQRKTGFIGILMGFTTLIGIYEEFVEKKILKFIPFYKFNQDHLELFFGTLRSKGGYNNNPTCRQFISAYKKILVHAEIRDKGAGNCVPLEQINVLNISSNQKSPVQIINESVPNRAEDIHGNSDLELQILSDHDYIFSYNDSPYSIAVVTYIAGFIAFKLGNKLQCENCVSHLFGKQEDFLDSLITQKSRGFLSYPSEDVVQICTQTEKILKIEQKIHENKVNKEIISLKSLKLIMRKKIFSEMVLHDLNPLESHKILLVKSVINLYLTTRIHFICKNSIPKDKIRNMYTKLILFKGQ